MIRTPSAPVFRFAVLAGIACCLALITAITPTRAQDYDFTYEPRIMGNPDAKVKVVEISSLLCPHCASFHADKLPTIKEEYIDTGKIAWEVKENSLGNPLATGASMILRCAPEDQYFNFMEVLFKNQRRWASAPSPLEALESYAGLMGLPRDGVRACLESDVVYQGILAGEQVARQAGANSTPTFLIDGRIVIRGNADLDEFREVLDDALAN
ncbi:MAG: DsbA family protein [Rhodospirillaceae bacterium]